MPEPRWRLDRRTFLQGTAAALSYATLGPLPSPPIAPSTRPPLTDGDRMGWWREARFGMFLHWGLYSILGGEWGGRTDYAEWIRNNAHIPLTEYDKLVARFNPTRFDADAWVTMAKDAGMRYITITTKHHDGFALFDSKQTRFCVRSTPFRRDVMKEMAEACRRQGLKICWYHSIMDWHHPDYLPRRDWEAGRRSTIGARYARYLAYLHAQVTELLTRYGEIGVMWFDGQWEQTWTHEMGMGLYRRCRELQPSVIVNNRVEGWSAAPITTPLGDFRTPEQEVPATGWPGVDWESCITMNHNWGYNSHDHDFKSVEELIGLLVETASKGGNLLLNVGPRPDGSFPDESTERLRELGQWMRVNGEAIYGTTASPFGHAPFRATSGPNRLNLFLAEWPATSLLAPGLRTPVRNARLLADPTAAISTTVREQGIEISLPATAPHSPWPVLVLEFDRPPIVAP